MILKRLLTPLLVAVGLLGLTALPAAAEARGRIENVQAQPDGTLRLVFSGIDLGTATLDPEKATVTIDGTAVEATATTLGNSATIVQRTAMLAIDTSGSMRGGGMAAAKAAAAAFLDVVPADVRVGVVTFSTTARVLAAPTTDRAALRRTIAALVPVGDTALYDAVVLALRGAGTTGARSVLLLTDGIDDGSRSTLAGALTAVRRAGIGVDAVALGTSARVTAPLQQLVAAAKGRVVASSGAAGLAAAFRSAAQAIAGQLVVTAEVPEELAGQSATVEVTVATSAGSVRDSTFVVIPRVVVPTAAPGPRPVDVDSSAASSRGVLWIGLGALFAGLLLLLSYVLRSSGTGGASQGMRRRLSIYTLTGRPQPERTEATSTVLGDSSVARTALELAGRVVDKRDFEASLARKLEAGGIPLRPAEWLVIHAGSTLGAALLGLLLGGGRLFPVALGLFAGAAVPQAFLIVKERRRGQAFLAQLPDTLQLIAGSLSAGYSLPQAIDTVVREAAEPMATEFRRVIVESRLGVTIEDALEGVAARMGSEDFRWVVMAIRIQREVGGNLAEVLTTVAETLRDRERIRRQVLVLSAEGRLSAVILGGLPPLFAVYLLLVRPEYVKPLYTDALGVLMSVTGAVMLLVGVFWLRKVVKVEV